MPLAEGFGLKEVSEFLGHCDIGTTANIYGHLQYQSKGNMGTRMNETLLAPDEPEDKPENEIA